MQQSALYNSDGVRCHLAVHLAPLKCEHGATSLAVLDRPLTNVQKHNRHAAVIQRGRGSNYIQFANSKAVDLLGRWLMFAPAPHINAESWYWDKSGGWSVPTASNSLFSREQLPAICQRWKPWWLAASFYKPTYMATFPARRLCWASTFGCDYSLCKKTASAKAKPHRHPWKISPNGAIDPGHNQIAGCTLKRHSKVKKALLPMKPL